MKENRIVFVDYLRMVACFLVMLVHASENFYAADASGLVMYRCSPITQGVRHGLSWTKRLIRWQGQYSVFYSVPCQFSMTVRSSHS